MRFLGSEADINIATEHPEFAAGKWVAIEPAARPHRIVQAAALLDVVQEFSQHRTVLG